MKKGNSKIVFLLLFFLIINRYAVAEVINIPDDKPTIQEGIEIAVDGDTVLVGDGVYSNEGSGNEPVVDFNSDGIVDAADMCIMIEHWLTDYPLCDIGPMPWGDGIVDVQDLIVLAEHLFEEVPPTEFVE